MENKNKSMKGFPAKIISKFIAIAAVMLSLAACNDSGGGSGYTNNNGLILDNCGSCSSISSPIALDTVQSQNMDSGAMLLQLRLYVSGAYFYPGVSSSYNNYNGPAAFQGQLVAQSDLYGYQSSCVIPRGTYQVRTQQVAQMGAAGTLGSSMNLIATGGGRSIYFTIYQGSMLLNQGGQIRLSGNIYVTNINGANCGNGFSDTFQ
jgi:hypothetical protein